MPINTWMNDWNDIIRKIIFPDEELRKLMLLPKGTTIINFIDKYFIRSGYTNELLEHEDVRIVYGTISAEDTQVANVKKQEMSFDIYVRREVLHNATDDRLQYRTQLIANRLVQLLTKNGKDGRYIGGYRFWVKNEQDLGTRTAGYVRYNVSFNFMRVY